MQDFITYVHVGQVAVHLCYVYIYINNTAAELILRLYFFRKDMESIKHGKGKGKAKVN